MLSPTVVDGMVYFRSVLVLNGNGADVAKHAVPAVPTDRYVTKKFPPFD